MIKKETKDWDWKGSPENKNLFRSPEAISEEMDTEMELLVDDEAQLSEKKKKKKKDCRRKSVV